MISENLKATSQDSIGQKSFSKKLLPIYLNSKLTLKIIPKEEEFSNALGYISGTQSTRYNGEKTFFKNKYDLRKVKNSGKFVLNRLRKIHLQKCVIL